MSEKKRNNWILWVLSVLLPPIGAAYLWIAKKEFSVQSKLILTAVFAMWFILSIAIGANFNGGSKQTKPVLIKIPAVEILTVSKTSNTSAEAEFDSTYTSSDSSALETDFTDVADSSAPLQDKTAALTTEQKKALSMAEEHLNYSAFSYSGLIEQLKYELFSAEEATYAADNCGADWEKQAANMAQEYLDFGSFSRNSLIEQLEYEGFTKKQAKYGASAVGY